ncbi:hypothetical protein BBJ28_00024829 [Nothophytophthora sp. Chile5]|nr:hypothetical protein BBJ28_00024829 [Nothophytophthora sp. Chile5]
MVKAFVSLVACAALLIASVSAGGYVSDVSDSSALGELADEADSYLIDGDDDTDEVDADADVDYEYADSSASASAGSVALGDSVVAGVDTNATAAPELVTEAPELAEQAGSYVTEDAIEAEEAADADTAYDDVSTASGSDLGDSVVVGEDTNATATPELVTEAPDLAKDAGSYPTDTASVGCKARTRY